MCKKENLEWLRFYKNKLGAAINIANENGFNVCKYNVSDTPETPRQSLKPDGRWNQYGHWESIECV